MRFAVPSRDRKSKAQVLISLNGIIIKQFGCKYTLFILKTDENGLFFCKITSFLTESMLFLQKNIIFARI